MNGETVLLYEMFPFCENSDRLKTDFSGARVVSAEVSKEKASMKLGIALAHPTPPADIAAIEEMVAREYGL